MSNRKKRLTRESYEEGRYEPLPYYKADEQIARLNNDLDRLNTEYENNKDEIIGIQKELIDRYNLVLSQLDEAYRQQLDCLIEEQEKTRSEVSRIKLEISSLEERTNVLAQEVNDNTIRLNEFIEQINKERERTRQLAISACNAAVDKFNEMVSNPIYLKFCYYKIKGVGFSLSKLNEPNMPIDTQYAIALNVLSRLVEIKSLSEVEWDKFIPAYESLHKEIDIFKQKLDKCREVILEDYPDNEIDLDFWSDNGYTTLFENTKRFVNRIESGRDAHGYLVPEVKLDNKMLQMFDSQLQTMVANAKEKARHSFRREEAGTDSLHRLKDYGFEKSICQFESGDERRPYVVEMVRKSDEWKVTLVFASEIQDRRAHCIIMHNNFIDPNMYMEFVTNIVTTLQNDCHLQCIMPDGYALMDTNYNYDEDVLKTDGNLNDKIQLIINNHKNLN